MLPEFKSQTEPLYPSELVQSYLFLDAAHKTGKNYFAFYNCKFIPFNLSYGVSVLTR